MTFRPETSQELKSLVIRTSGVVYEAPHNAALLDSNISVLERRLEELESAFLQNKREVKKIGKELKEIKRKIQAISDDQVDDRTYRLLVLRLSRARRIYAIIYGTLEEVEAEKAKYPNNRACFDSECFSFKRYLLDFNQSAGETVSYNGLTYEYQLKSHCTESMFIELLQRCVDN